MYFILACVTSILILPDVLQRHMSPYLAHPFDFILGSFDPVHCLRFGSTMALDSQSVNAWALLVD